MSKRKALKSNQRAIWTRLCARALSGVALELLGAQWLLRTTRDRPAEQREALLCPWGVYR